MSKVSNKTKETFRYELALEELARDISKKITNANLGSYHSHRQEKKIELMKDMILSRINSTDNVVLFGVGLEFIYEDVAAATSGTVYIVPFITDILSVININPLPENVVVWAYGGLKIYDDILFDCAIGIHANSYYISKFDLEDFNSLVELVGSHLRKDGNLYLYDHVITKNEIDSTISVTFNDRNLVTEFISFLDKPYLNETFKQIGQRNNTFYCRWYLLKEFIIRRMFGKDLYELDTNMKSIECLGTPHSLLEGESERVKNSIFKDFRFAGSLILDHTNEISSFLDNFLITNIGKDDNLPVSLFEEAVWTKTSGKTIITDAKVAQIAESVRAKLKSKGV